MNKSQLKIITVSIFIIALLLLYGSVSYIRVHAEESFNTEYSAEEDVSKAPLNSIIKFGKSMFCNNTAISYPSLFNCIIEYKDAIIHFFILTAYLLSLLGVVYTFRFI